ncbi:hypothetical protein [Streptomyces hydrogenans]|uniref:hypothetical protein n=1 Tax=Streptomyces hydrogenans TaxID=1873719 RepID=UPI0027DF3AD9|nr:hypothetical protein [Streptomyces hydrogenans]
MSRILSGERTPSWQVTSDIVEACGGDLEAVRPLWEAARGYRVRATGHFPRCAARHAARRRQHPPRRAVRPHRTHTLRAPGHRPPSKAPRPPTGATVSTLVTALRGQPEAIHPLWQATQPAPATGNRSFKTSSLSAESFG